MEMSMNAVERVGEYCNLPQEPPPHVPGTPPPAWPKEGDLRLEDVCLKYETSSQLVVKHLTMHVPARASVGVVGRTGAGKSTLSIALLRMIEAHSGRILIDGVDISTLGLDDLRQAVAVVPQDPVLFTGTVRFNLDPFDRHTDEEVRNALRRVQLHDLWAKRMANKQDGGQRVSEQSESGGGTGRESGADSGRARARRSSVHDVLDLEVTEGGGNLSVGERQLLCLARALLRSSKLLVMDEATANVDPETDRRIQSVIREELANATVITVAHRIHTVIFYDLIAVMEAGELVEFGSPLELIKNQGRFYRMCKKTGNLDGLTAEAERKASLLQVQEV